MIKEKKPKTRWQEEWRGVFSSQRLGIPIPQPRKTSDLYRLLYKLPKALSGASLVVQVVKNPPADAGDTRDAGSIPGLGRSPGGGNGNLLQYSCLGNPMDRGARWATVHGVVKSKTNTIM